MVEVCVITSSEQPNPDTDWALIERDELGRYVGSGSKADADGKRVHFYTPPAYDSKEEAVRAAQAWAALGTVSVVYVREDN